MTPIVHAVSISEIMYNPVGSDNNLEYVEVISEEEINLSEYTIEDAASSDGLVLLQYWDSVYYLIVEEGFNYSGVNASVYSAGATIGNNLHNEGDVVLVRYKDGSVVDVVSYTDDVGGDGNGMSLCMNVTLFECLPTPGYENMVNVTNETSEGNETNGTLPDVYVNVKITEFLPNPQGLDSDSLPDGEWVEVMNDGEAVDVEGLELCDKDWNCVEVTGETTGGSTFVPSGGYLVVYMNGKSILNNAGKEYVRLVSEGEILDEVVYEGSTEGLSWALFEGEWVMAEPTPGGTNIFDEDDTKDVVGISLLTITTLYVGRDDRVKFGDVFDVRVHVYKGKTNKQKVLLYVENVSRKVQFNVIENYQEYELVLPLVIDDNCDGDYNEGVYDVVLEGLDMKTSLPVLVNGSSAPCGTVMNFTVLTQGRSGETLLHNSSTKENRTGIMVYSSIQEHMKRYGLYGVMMLLVFVFGYFLFVKS